MSFRIIIVTISLFCLFSLWGQVPPLKVFVTLPPQQFLVERIGGQEVTVNCLVSEGQNPHTFEVTPQVVKRLGEAQIFFKIGESFEAQLIERITKIHKRLLVEDMSKGVLKRKMEEGDEDEKEDHNDHHHHTFYDPHIWLSPLLLIIEGQNVVDGLSKLKPSAKKAFQDRFDKLKMELEQLHEKLSKDLLPFKGKEIYTFHPDFGYFTDLYVLKQVPVEYSGKTPTPKQLTHLLEKFKKSSVKTIFVQPQFDHRSAKIIADAIGGKVVELNPMQKNVIQSLNQIAEAFKVSFSVKTVKR